MNWIVALGIVGITVVAIVALREDPYAKRKKGDGGMDGDWFDGLGGD